MRKQTRRSFTVEIKHSPLSGRTSIPAKPRQVPEQAKRLTDPVPALLSVFEPRAMSTADAPKAKETRRILPSLVAWQPSEPASASQVIPEAPLPPVRRVVTHPRISDSSPPTDRPQTPAPEAAIEAAIEARPELPHAHNLEPVQPTPVSFTRADRSVRVEGAVLPRGERWKRRLPRACW